MIRYKKSLVVILLAGGVLLVGLIVYNYQTRHENPQRQQPKTTGNRGIFAQKVLSKKEIFIQNPEDVLHPGAIDFGEEFLTCMTYQYTEDTPLVEIFFSRRGKSGEVEPFKVWSVNIRREDGFPMGGFSLEGRNKLRMGVGTIQEGTSKNRWTLLRGTQYYINKYSPVVGGDLVSGLQPRFTVPENLQGDQVYRVELIVKDEILEQEQLEKEKALARQKQEKAEREKIVIVIRQPPEPNSRLIGLYSDGQKKREFKDKEGVMTLMGPNKLGGDLMVGIMAMHGDQHLINVLHPWIYVENLQQRQLTVPDEADLVVSPDQLVDIKILLEDEQDEWARLLKKIFFFTTRKAKVPLFCVQIEQLNETESDYVINMPLLPGTYYPQGFIYDGQVGKWIPLGTLDISKEKGKVYSVKLPK